MVTVVRLGNVRIRVFAGDHAPPHFHIWTAEGEAMVSLQTLAVIRGSVRKQELALALKWAKQNIDLLNEHWVAMNGDE
jgi:hypothetical protein